MLADDVRVRDARAEPLVGGREVRVQRDHHAAFASGRRVVGGDHGRVVVDPDAVPVPDPDAEAVPRGDRVDRPGRLAGRCARRRAAPPRRERRRGRTLAIAARSSVQPAERDEARQLDPVARRSDDLDVDGDQVAVANGSAVGTLEEVGARADEDQGVPDAARAGDALDDAVRLPAADAGPHVREERLERLVADRRRRLELGDVLGVLQRLDGRHRRGDVDELGPGEQRSQTLGLPRRRRVSHADDADPAARGPVLGEQRR